LACGQQAGTAAELQGGIEQLGRFQEGVAVHHAEAHECGVLQARDQAQRGGVLGWTCGNMAASTLDVAQFYRDLLVTKTILQPATVELMESFNVLNYGWEKGRLWYGAGLMIEQSASAHDHTITFPPDFRQWGSYIGHGGDTYGFLSEQGIVGGLGNASFSVVANMDYETSFVQGAMACRTISTAAKVLLNVKLNITCGT
jgi:hypothetical protein